MIHFAPGSNILAGMNAQGKTNVLEAIYMGSCARSHRTGKDQEMIRAGASRYEIFLQFAQDNGAEASIRLCFSDLSGNGEAKKEREIYYNGMRLDRISDLFGLFHAVVFAPEDVMLVKEGPAGRRRFLDMLISQLSPSYFRDLQLYQRILSQRNHLLKKIRDKGLRRGAEEVEFERLHLAVWNEKMADCAARIIQLRFRYLCRLEEKAAKALRDISNTEEELKIHYRGVPSVDPAADVASIRSQFLARLERYEEDDCQKGNCNHGPHRDDMEMSLNNLLIRPFASQGQQRSVVLALKIAELQIIEEECEEKAVLLLDDVMSELDWQRRRRLLEAIQGHQVFITCTDATKLDLSAGFQIDSQLCPEPEMDSLTSRPVDLQMNPSPDTQMDPRLGAPMTPKEETVDKMPDAALFLVENGNVTREI